MLPGGESDKKLLITKTGKKGNKDGQIIVTELLSGLLNEMYGFHFLEPTVSFQKVSKIKPVGIRKIKPKEADEGPAYMKLVTRKSKQLEPIMEIQAGAYM